MQRVRSGLARSNARRGFVAIVGGTGAAQVVTVVALPFLTRVYTPSDMALYGVVIGMSALVASFASLRLETAIPLPDDEGDSRRLLWISFGASLLTSLAFVIFGTLFPAATTALWPEATLGVWIYATALLALAISVYSAVVQMAIRLQRYSEIGRVTLIQGLATVAGQLLMSAGQWAGGLVWGALAGRSVGLVTMARISLGGGIDVPRPRQVAQLLRRYWRFPAVFAPTAAVNVLGIQLAMLVFPTMYGVAAAGMYALAVRVAAIPGSLIGGAAQQVYIGELARTPSGRDSTSLFLRWSRGLGVLALLSALGFWFVLPGLMGTIFGPTWEPAAEYVKYLGVMTSFGLLGSPMQGTWTVYQSALARVAWDIARLGSYAIALLIASRTGASAEMAVALLAVAGSLAYVVSWLACFGTVQRRRRPQDDDPTTS